MNSSLADALRSVTKALIARNSRLANEVIESRTPAGDEITRILWKQIQSLAELVLRINEEPQLKAYEDLPRVAEIAIQALESPEKSEEYLVTAREIFDTINRDVQVMMKKTPNNVNRGVNLILAAEKYLDIVEFLRFKI